MNLRFEIRNPRPTARDWLDRIRALPDNGKVRIMNVCGGHERSISMAGLRAVLPPYIELIPGPGCPVCVCPEEDVYQAIQLALNEKIILVAFGDMLRVPVNAPKRDARSLEQAKARGADVRPVASPTEAVRIAQENPDTAVVFFAAGFETTMAPVAAMLAEGVPENLFVLLSGRLTWPAVAMLLSMKATGDAQGCASAGRSQLPASRDTGTSLYGAGDTSAWTQEVEQRTEQLPRTSGAAFDALVAPGHVSTVMGPEEWEFVVRDHGLPAAVAGFTPESLLAAFYSVLRQRLEGRRFLDNCYPEVAHAGGNPTAKQQLAQTMDVVDANWRGVGVIPKSGFSLKLEYAAHDARVKFASYDDEARKRRGEMPPGCDCARVVLGKIYPNECILYGRACTPRHPIGPCMVSDEGACRIWWASGVREAAPDVLSPAALAHP